MELRMSGKERDRLSEGLCEKVMAALAQRRMRQKEASRLLRLSERQARRILARYRASIGGGLRGSKVIVEERLDGSMRLGFQGRYLRFHEVPSAKAPPAPRPPQPGVGASRRGGPSGRLALPPLARPPLAQTLQADTFALHKTGHFCFALTPHFRPPPQACGPATRTPPAT